MVAEGFLWVLALCLGLAASTLLFFAFFRLLAQPEHPQPVAVVRLRSWAPSLFEVLKQLSTFLLKATANSEAFQAFGIALILMVWINYFSRVVVLSAAWAHTSPEARAIRDANRVADQMPEGPRIDLAAAAPGVRTASAASSAPPRRPPSPPAPPRCSGSSPSSAAGAERSPGRCDVRSGAPPERCVSHIPSTPNVAPTPPAGASRVSVARAVVQPPSRPPDCGWATARNRPV